MYMWTFNPIFKSVIWGGDKIAKYKGVATSQENIGESWEISGVEGSESVVADGPDAGLSLSQLIDRYKAKLLGERNYSKYGNAFPLLIKFIDARQDLSVQVHPSDELAQKRGAKFGKTEMWYVLGTEKGARLANGFNRVINPDEYERLVESGEIMDALSFNNIKSGDTFFIPAGRVHAIGKGSFIAEIQETSDITYRLYDYKRKDKDGNERQLHTKEAFDAINFSDVGGSPIPYKPHRDIPVNLVTSPFFTTNIWHIDHDVMRDYSEWDTFIVLICTKGKAEITTDLESRVVKEGESVLIPASCSKLQIKPSGVFEALETYIK
ncbi:MAG: class I mannose-6-phosphate isomerase [Muribaculaceae bacterium]|nr:class I mannose-6-phosphate isomerase [Muribaculaceae bacterium]